MHRTLRSILSVLVPLLLTVAGGVTAADNASLPLLGFSNNGAATERALEQRFDAQLKAAQGATQQYVTQNKSDLEKMVSSPMF